MEYLQDPDTQNLAKLLALSLLTFILGRFSKRLKRENSFSKSLAALNLKVHKSAEKKLYFSVLTYRFKVYSSFSLIFSILLTYLLYFPLNTYTDYKEHITSASLLLTFTLYILSFYSTYKSSEYTQSEALHMQQLALIRSEIVKEIGPEVVDALRGNECSKKCTDQIEIHQKLIEKYKKLIDKFGKFQWCDGCSQQKKCAGNCGPEFWLFAKNSLREFKLS